MTSVHELFEAQARRTPDAVAVSCEGESASYRELNERANQLAHHLRGLGVGPETLVALCVERSLEMVVSILGVLKAGGAYVPLDPAYPADRVQFVLEDSGAPVLVTQESQLASLPRHSATVVCIDRDRPAIDGHPPENPSAGVQAENLAYVIYTSGSTGKPKGVLVEHRNVMRLFTATEHWFAPGPSDTWTLFHSYAFDFSVWELWGALLYGGRLVIVPQWVTRSPQSLAELIAAEGVTFLNATPSLFLAVMPELLERSERLALRAVVFGGEALQPRLLRPWFERFGDQRPRLVNMYGITETTVHVTYRPLVSADAEQDASPIGEPIPDLELHVLDAELKPAPVGTAGELFVGGAGVARGYLNRPELTAERFLDNPFGSGRLYRSGDRARRLEDGDVEYLGRNDNQVKVRGFRIELGEVETALARHPNVAAAVVDVRGSGAEAALAAWVVAREAPLTGSELRQFLARTLPEHMVPSTVNVLSELPLTPNGKVDRKALPEPTRERSEDREIVEPRTPTERKLAQIWEHELEIQPIGVTDELFELGVTSIAAARLFARVQRDFGDRLPLAAIFRAPSIELLARMLDQGADGPNWSSLVPIQPEGTQPPLFCIHAGPGDVLQFPPLAKRMGPDQPVYGLQARGLFGDVAPLTAVTDMASHYLSEMRQVCPHGPWRLSGLCLGGLIAYEIAQQVTAAGETVELLAVFNAPSPVWARENIWYGYQQSVAAKRPKVKPLTRKQRLARAVREPRRFWTALVFKYHKRTDPRRARKAHEQGRGVPESARKNYFSRLAGEAQRGYDIQPYDGKMLMIYGNGLYEAPDLGWTGIATNMEIHVVPGEHMLARQMLEEPHVEWLSERLKEELARVGEAEPVGSGAR